MSKPILSVVWRKEVTRSRRVYDPTSPDGSRTETIVWPAGYLKLGGSGSTTLNLQEAQVFGWVGKRGKLEMYKNDPNYEVRSVLLVEVENE